jgi:hypothetical protein
MSLLAQRPPSTAGAAGKVELLGGNTPLNSAKSQKNQAIRDNHLAFRSTEIYGLGGVTLFHLFRELANGEPLWGVLETYAALTPLADFIRENAGDKIDFTLADERVQ